MSAGQQGQCNNVYVVLQSSFSDLFRSQTDTGVDNFKTSVAQSTSYNFSTAVMAIQTRFST